jgi:16S rRNA (cytidine1402-2'-O)-methyltransferase
VLLVAPPGEGAAALAEADLDAKISEALAAYSVKDAASVVSAATGQPRRQVYARALQLSTEKGK